MGQNLGNGAPGQGSEDNMEATRHAESAEANRDALEAQNRRTEATAPPEVREPIDHSGTGGHDATTGNRGTSGGGASA
jgi:hypothetical protein